MIHRVVSMYQQNFEGAYALPKYTGVEPKYCIPELERAINELGFIGCNLNPDPSGAMWSEPPAY